MATWEVLADGKISVLLFVSLYEPSDTLRLSNHAKAEHFFGSCFRVFCQAGPPQVLSCSDLQACTKNRKIVLVNETHKE